MLLDEPTAAMNATNTPTVIELMREAVTRDFWSTAWAPPCRFAGAQIRRTEHGGQFNERFP